MSDPSPAGPDHHGTPVREHLRDVWELAKVGLRELLNITIIALLGFALQEVLTLFGKSQKPGQPEDKLFSWFVTAVKVVTYTAFVLIMTFSLVADVVKAFRRLRHEFRRPP